MERFALTRAGDGAWSLDVPLRGDALLGHAMYNKGSAFTEEERAAFGLVGKLPDAVSTIEQQSRRICANIRRNADPLEQYVGLAALQERNETLFYRALLDHLEEFLPIVYTPTVGRACQEYSHIFRRGRGLWITPEHRGRVASVLRNTRFEGVRLICVTDNERILGLGDQGAGGIGIPIGKLALYTAAAGIHPAHTLPISLDVGTDNEALLADDLYLGWRHPRLRGAEYDALVEELVTAVMEVFPGALLQWEDFKKQNAFTLLDRYRERLCSFNDDIQGTAAVAVSGLFAAGRISGRALSEERVVILGAGAAGIGIARQLRAAMERVGLAGEALGRAIAVLDSRGLLTGERVAREPYKADFSWPAERVRAVGLGEDLGLQAVVRALKPTALLGTSGQAGQFDEATVRAMAAAVERPAIFPLSNPTSKAEATPEQLLRWTDGAALIATGSPFAPVEHGGRTHRIAQCNNVWVFPGLGLGALLTRARRVTDALFTVAAETLAAGVEPHDLEAGLLFPPIHELREHTARVAAAVAREAIESGIAQETLPEQELEAQVKAAMWEPVYPRYVPV